MKWSGHSDYQAMKPYIEITEKTKADAMKLFEQEMEKVIYSHLCTTELRQENREKEAVRTFSISPEQSRTCSDYTEAGK